MNVFTAHYYRRHIRQKGLHEAFFLVSIISLSLDILIIGGDEDDEIGRSKINSRDNNASSQDAGWPRQSEVKHFRVFCLRSNAQYFIGTSKKGIPVENPPVSQVICTCTPCLFTFQLCIPKKKDTFSFSKAK